MEDVIAKGIVATKIFCPASAINGLLYIIANVFRKMSILGTAFTTNNTGITTKEQTHK